MAKRNPRITEDEKQWIYQKRREGYSIRQIAVGLNRGKSTVAYHLMYAWDEIERGDLIYPGGKVNDDNA